jgi:DNA-binding LytR/AlgR family response regulator
MIGVKLNGRIGDESDIVEFWLSEVKYISVRNATKNKLQIPVFHTVFGEFLPLRTLNELSRAYFRYGFMEADRSTIVNTNMVRILSKRRSNSYVEFIDGTKIRISNSRK